jgi:hypothetical protein
MAERTDHFARMRGEDGPTVEPPAGAPLVSLELIEWLEKEFPTLGPRDWDGLDGAVNLLGLTAASFGHQQVIQHLRTLVKVA